VGLKSMIVEGGMKLLQDPRFGKFATDPRVMRAIMQAMAMPGKVQEFTSEQIAGLAKKLNLASEEDVAQLRRTVRRLEEDLARERRGGGRD